MKSHILTLAILCNFLWCCSQPYEGKVVGYFPTYRDIEVITDKTDFSQFSHLMIAFANPDMEGNVAFTNVEQEQITRFIRKAHQARCHVLLSIGGGSTAINNAWEHNMKEVNREVIIDNLISLMNQYNFDGIDVDLEGDLLLNDDYAGFVKDLHAKVPENKLYTAALATWSANTLSDETLDLYDIINVMSYDQRGPWSPDDPGQHSSIEFAESDINYWKNTRGIEANRITLGLPFYGYNFSNTSNIFTMAYNEIVSLASGAESSDQVGDIYYNGIPTIQEKTKLAGEEVGGVMIWEITQDIDDERSLLAAISEMVIPERRMNIERILDTKNKISEIQIYPTYVQDLIHIETDRIIKKIAIKGINSSLAIDLEPNQNAPLNLSNLNSGLYLMDITFDNEVEHVKFIKL